jgi:hypothetical protein
MSGMVPGLHENTRPQRKGRDGAWADPGGDAFEPRDAPPRWVGLGIAGLIVALALSVALVLGFTSASRPRTSLHADGARARFHTPAPGLETDPPAGRLALERAHPAPSGAALEAAMRAVVAQGWGDTDPAPDRAETAMKRAEAMR